MLPTDKISMPFNFMTHYEGKLAAANFASFPGHVGGGKVIGIYWSR